MFSWHRSDTVKSQADACTNIGVRYYYLLNDPSTNKPKPIMVIIIHFLYSGFLLNAIYIVTNKPTIKPIIPITIDASITHVKKELKVLTSDILDNNSSYHLYGLTFIQTIEIYNIK